MGRAMSRLGGTVMRAIRTRFKGVHLRHSWYDIEVTGRVRVQECAECRRTRIRII
jgi:hypothetical protein